MEENFIINNDLDQLPVIAGKVEEIAEKWDLPMPLSMNINLVIEEAITNIIFYAFEDKGNHKIHLKLSLNENEIELRIEDEGIPFDPTSKSKPDITLPTEERPIGGLGIYLISKIMDDVQYKREEKKNILILKKKINL